MTDGRIWRHMQRYKRTDIQMDRYGDTFILQTDNLQNELRARPTRDTRGSGVNRDIESYITLFPSCAFDFDILLLRPQHENIDTLLMFGCDSN